jgi:hypothetical protein
LDQDSLASTNKSVSAPYSHIASAARIIERMVAEGVVSQANRVGRREVLVGDHSG